MSDVINQTPPAGNFGVSQPVRRKEDNRFLTGTGKYLDDHAWPGQARAVFARAPVAHAVLKSLDVSAAKAAPGVLAVYTAADLEEIGANWVAANQGQMRDGSPAPQPTRPVLAKDRVRYVGEAVAMIVAETLGAARDAAELVEMDLDELDAVSEMDAALADGAPQLHDVCPRNTAFEVAYGEEAETEAALASAAHVVTLSLVNNRVVSNPMETRGAIARWDATAGKLEMETGAQGVWPIKSEIAERLQLQPAQVRVTTADVGGGFGTKSYIYPEQIAVAFAAKALERPVKWVADRGEGFLTDSMGRDHLTTATAAFDADHRLQALKIETKAGMGAYLSPNGVIIPTFCAVKVLPGVYDVQKYYFGVVGVFTNTTPVDAYRGAGRPESIYVIERLMDKAAREFSIDPLELRRKNYIAPEKMPYKSAVGELYDTGDFHKVTNAAVEKADVAGFAARRAASEAKGRLRGLGVCYYIESILGSHDETAKIAVTDAGRVELFVGTQSNGQGHETVFPQILHGRIGLPFDKIDLVQGDSDRIADGGGTGGSRSVTMQGAAINATADVFAERLKPLAEEELEVGAADLELRDGAFVVKGTDRSVDLISLGLKARQSGKAELSVYEMQTTVPGRSYPNGCHIAEVEIDPGTGAVTIEKYTMVDDFGLLMNPMLAEGQAQGGVVQGIGQALMEFVTYDETGQLQNGSFMDYAMPRADDAPWLVFHHEPTPSTSNPIGMKGCGEAGTVGALAAITNAALDAMWPQGVRHVEMPLTPQRVWTLLQQAAPAHAAE